MPLHKKTITGDVTQTLSYTVPTADAYGAQVLGVRFYDGSGELVTPTGGLYECEWSPNDVKSGVTPGASFYLVFDTVTNQKTEGMFTIAYEEIF